MRFFLSKLRLIIYSIISVIFVFAIVWIGNSLFVVVWQPHTIFFSPNKQYRDNFGATIAIDGDTLVVGSSGDRPSNIPGAIYVYVHSGSTWQLQARLMEENTQRKRHYGFAQSVDISENTIVVSTDQPVRNPVYVFERQGSAWVQQARLEFPESLQKQRVLSQFANNAVAIDGNTLVIGAEGAAYVYTRNTSTDAWTYETVLISPDRSASLDESTQRCNFGSAVDVSGNTIVVGSRKSPFGVASNCTNIFVRHPTTSEWVHQALLLPDVCESIRPCNKIGGFGYSVAINQNAVVVGTAATLPGPFAYCDSSGGEAAYIFERTPGTTNWRQTATLHPKGLLAKLLAARCGFGEQVAISNDMVLVSGVGFRAAPHLFKRDANTGRWRYQAETLVNPNTAHIARNYDSKQSVAMSALHAAIGDTTLARNKQAVKHSGAFYLLDLPKS